MHMNIRLTGTGVLAVAALAAGAWYWHTSQQEENNKNDGTLVTNGGPIARTIDTNGGQLTVAILKVTGEQFNKEDPRSILGFQLGTTKSKVQADVTYRYHIEMERKWQIKIDGRTAIIRAGDIKPSLPAAFDSATVRKQTENGWARFNKDENLTALEQSITAQLQTRAVSPQYDQIVKDAARETVKVFVTTWLLSQRQWGREPEYRVVVLFPGETAADHERSSRTSNP